MGHHLAGAGAGEDSEYAARGLSFYLTTMYYDLDSEENSSASVSDPDNESVGDNGSQKYDDDDDDARSNSPFGEDLRVCSFALLH